MQKRVQTFFFLGIFLSVGALAFFIFLPFFDSLLLGAILAVIFYPLYAKILAAFGGKRKALASGATTLLIFVVVCIPLVYIGTVIVQEASGLYFNAASGGANVSIIARATDLIKHSLGGIVSEDSRFFDNVSGGVDYYTTQFLSWLIENLGGIFSSVLRVLFSIVLSLFALYFFLKDGPDLKNVISAISPLDDKYDEEIANRLAAAVSAVVKGTLLVALAQGIAAGLGFWIFGLPSATVWGLAAVIASLVPIIGTAIVTIPAAIYMFLIGDASGAIGVFAWGTLLVGLVDNFLRPKLIERSIRIHPFLIFLSVLGGIEVMGPIGFLAGPLVLSLLAALFSVYKEQFRDQSA